MFISLFPLYFLHGLVGLYLSFRCTLFCPVYLILYSTGIDTYINIIFQIFDRLCQSFCGDVFGALFSSAKGLSISPPEKLRFSTWRFVSDLALTMAASNILTA